ncbi:hypothetical protein OAU25_00550 [Crocinitomicaceae bacterium]|nr:hypothetical protein [Crocinitomicaceae bacterium]
MNKKYTIAILLGILSAGILVFILELFSHSLYPVDMKEFTEIINSKDPVLFEAFVLKQPLGSFISIILAHGFGLLGGLVISRLIFRRSKMSLYIITAIMLLANTVNFLAMPHPTWFPFADLGFTIIIAFMYISSRRKT